MKPLKALLVEDSKDDAALLLRHLFNEGYDVRAETVQTAADMKTALAEGDWDLILSAYSMPHFSGLEALSILKQSGLSIPFIVISGTIGEGVAVEAMVCGVDDYLMKDNLARLAPAIERELENAARRRQQKQAEESLRRSEESKHFLASIVESAKDSVISISFDGIITSWNAAAELLYGYAAPETVGKPLTMLTLPEDLREMLGNIDKIKHSRQVEIFETERIGKDGHHIFLEVTMSPVKNDGGEVIGVSTIARDITERKRQELSLVKLTSQIEQQARVFNTTLSSITDFAYIFDRDGRFVHTNKPLLDLLGLTLDEVVGKNFFDLPYPDELAARLQQQIQQVFDTRQEVRDETPYTSPTGVSGFYEYIFNPVFAADGAVEMVAGSTRDITERKRAEDEKELLVAQIEQQHERLNNIVDNVSGVVWEAWGRPDAATQQIDFISDYVETMLGYTIEEWCGTPNFWLSIVHPEDQERMMRVAAENFLNSQSYTEEFRWVAKDGRTVWVETHSTVICDEEGQAIGYRGVNIDITERKRLEEVRIKLAAELDSERARLQHIIEHIPAFIVVLRGPDLVFEMANPAYYPIVDNREVIGLPLREALPELEGQGFFELISNVYNTGEVFTGNELSVQLVVPDSNKREQRYVNLMYMPLREADDSISGVLSYGIDVTEQVLSRIKIQESVREQLELTAQLETERKRLVAAQSVAKVGSWETDLVTLEVNWSAETFRIFELDPNQFKPDHRGFLQFVHPDDRATVDDAFAKSFDQPSACSLEHRILLADGGIKFIEERWEIFRDEQGKPLQSIGTCQDITEHKKTETALRQAEDKYRSLVESSPAVVYLAEPVPPYSTIYVSPNITMFGYTTEEWFSRDDLWMSIIHPEDRDRVLLTTANAMRQGLDTDLEYRIIAGDGKIHWLEDRGHFVFDEQGNRTGWQGVILDITETKVLEEQLRQSQKLESVGLLAGGIAHDFNNMLTVINGYCELTLHSLKADDPLRRNIEEIRKAGERSADLTYQLLAFSRQQILQPKILSLNQVIADTGRMLERLIGEDIELITVFSSKVGQVKVDPGQLSQIITNLALNARDAMPQGGKLTIETDNTTLDQEDGLRYVNTVPGEYVMMSVSDTGMGMDAETKRHIFEPFFTTKEVGKGTGLGLATAYGIVKQSGGNIFVSSEQGVGTTFKIYFPRVVEESFAEVAKDSSEESPNGTETILLVEDEEIVRSVAHHGLEEYGYTVLEAGNGVEALSLCEQTNCHIDLLMTDVVMPQMGGRELAERFAHIYPQMRILFTSGYTADAVVRHGVIEAGANFIQKPFTPHGLALKVREILDGLEEN